MRLLIITHTFPPAPHSNSKRPYIVAKGALDAGWEVDVMTSIMSLPPGQEETLEHPRLRISRCLHPWLSRFEAMSKWPKLTRLLSRLCYGLTWPDFFAPWAKRIFKDGKKLATYDRVLAFITPPAVLLAGKRKGLVGSHWIFDYQESISPQFRRYPRSSPLQRLLTGKLERLERKTLQQAGRVIFTAESNRQAYLSADLVSKSITEHIPYFFEEDKFAETRPVDPGFEIRYFGQFDLHGNRNPGIFLKALVAFLERHPEARSETRFVFHGHWEPKHDHFFEGLGLEGVIEIHSPVPYEDYLEGLKRSPVLLLVIAEIHNLYMPSKIVDYFGAKRPVLAFVPDSSEMKTVLDQAGMSDYTSSEKDIEGGARAIEKLWQRYQEDRLEATDGKTDFWSSKTQIPKYLDVLKASGSNEI